MRATDVTAGSILYMARARAALSQRELGERAGVSQSVVAAYEGGTREPSMATLAALVEATGVSLEVDLGEPVPVAGRTGRLGHLLRRRRAAVLKVADKYGVTDVRIFGSAARGEDGPDSDLDLLVRLPDGAGLFLLGRLKDDLEKLLHVAVDVVPDDGVKPRVRANIDADLIPL